MTEGAATTAAVPAPFLLLQPGQAREKEEPTGSTDLMAFFGLSRLYAFSQSKFVPEPYLRGLAGDTTLRRGPQTDLAPLIDVFPSVARPELRPFTAEELQAAFALQPGAYELPEAERGAPVVTSLRGPATSSGSGRAGEKRKRDKQEKKAKDKKDKKEKREKRKRQHSEETLA